MFMPPELHSHVRWQPPPPLQVRSTLWTGFGRRSSSGSPPVAPVLDRLLDEGLMTQEQYENVRCKETDQEKMRALYQCIRGWSDQDKDSLWRAMKDKNPPVIKNLEGDATRNQRHCEDTPGLLEFKKRYMESVKEDFQNFEEHNSRLGEDVSLQEIYTALIMRRGHQRRKSKKQEISHSGKAHLQIREKDSAEYPQTSIKALFDSKEDGRVCRIVVLQGPPGIGKTVTCHKIMLDWASGDLYEDKFDFAFYLSCRELNNISAKTNILELLSRSCSLPCSEELELLLKDYEHHKKLLLVIDGLDEWKWTLGEVEVKSDVCQDPFKETHKEIILLNLMQKKLLQQSSLLITTRPTALEKIKSWIKGSRYVEIKGFDKEGFQDYFYKFFGNTDDTDLALRMIDDNDHLSSMCTIPIMCWIVCTVLTQHMATDLKLLQSNTTTSLYLLYLEGLILHHGRGLPARSLLRKLCALANEGVITRKILFEKSDLMKHGLSLSEAESLLLNENIFNQSVKNQSSYSFIHLSVQELLAALHYVLDDGSGADDGAPRLPEICRGSWLDHQCNGHLHLLVQFLFGFLNEKLIKEFSENTGCAISLRHKSAIGHWLAEGGPVFGECEEAISCLYETQNGAFIAEVMASSYADSSSFQFCTYDEDDPFYKGHLRRLNYCLKFYNSFKTVRLINCAISSHFLEMLSPALHQCQEIIIFSCSFTSSSCNYLNTLLITNQSLKKLALSRTHLQDSDVKRLCEGLIHPRCALQEMRLYDSITSSYNSTQSFWLHGEVYNVITANRRFTLLETITVTGVRQPRRVDHWCNILRGLGCSVERDDDSCWGDQSLKVMT